jgi:hypothetical protein
MAKQRGYFAATVLANGKVLATGGYNNSEGALAASELYDPVTGTWSNTTTPMLNPRSYHSAVPLANNRVLLIGGWNNGVGTLNLVELYNATTGLFYAVRPMISVRHNYMQGFATLLANGKVLVAGGRGIGNEYLNTTEIFDPPTGNWAATGNLAVERGDHTLTRLNNGKVLIVGRYQGATNELFDPVTGTSIYTGNSITGRSYHSSVLLNNGKVLIAGGRDDADATLASAELFDPAIGTFSATGSMNQQRREFTLTKLANGKVLAVGGYNANGRVTIGEEYDPATGTWGTITIALPRSQHTAALLSTGKVLVAGGWGNGDYLSSAELYTPDIVNTTTTLTATSNPVPPNYNTTFTANVSYASAVPTGTVTFKIDGATTAAVSLTAGKATYNTTALAVGTHTVQALYAGNSVFAASSSDVLTETVQNSVLDFVVTNVVLTPITPIAKGVFNATVTVKNQGLTSGDGGSVSIWAHQNAVQACNASGDKTAAVGILAAGASVAIPITGIAAPTISGAKMFRAMVDGTCAAEETDEVNNQFTKAYRVAAAASGKADFVITSITNTPTLPLPNGTLDVVVTVKNQGTTAGNAGNLVLWSNQATAVTCNTTGNKTVAVGNLEVGASTSVTVTGLAAGVAGAKTLRGFIDSSCATLEANEINNQAIKTYSVLSQPDFVVTNVTLTPANPPIGSTFKADVTVKNQGTADGAGEFLDVWINRDAVAPCGAAGNAWAEVGTLAAGATKTFTFTDLAVGTVGGSKTFRAVVDSWCATPEALDGNNQLTKTYLVPAPSCKAIKAANAASTSGVYMLDPDGPTGAIAPFNAYCDMTTDNGGWTLVLAYKHVGGDNNELVLGVPTNPTTGYAHLPNAKMQQLNAYTEARFYCTTSGHTRVMHFKTNNQNALAYLKTGTTNAVDYWKTGFTSLTGHTANLPAAVDSYNDYQDDYAMTEFTFYGGVSHWSMRGSGYRWNCDDDVGSENTTLHQVWVR